MCADNMCAVGMCLWPCYYSVPHAIAICSKASRHAKQADRHQAGLASAVTGGSQTGKIRKHADSVSK